MAKDIIPKVKEDYQFYRELVIDEKVIRTKMLYVSEDRPNNKNYLEATEGVQHTKHKDDISFIINVKRQNFKYFQFKLKCKSLSDKPYFRYDSDGGTHRNYGTDLPLEEQKVDTPHFHRYNEDGINIAYKTPAIKGEGNREQYEDIHQCIDIFCNEANLRSSDGYTPSIIIEPFALQLKHIQEDPNSNVNFL